MKTNSIFTTSIVNLVVGTASMVLAGAITATVALTYALSRQVEVNSIAIEQLSKSVDSAEAKNDRRIETLELNVANVKLQVAQLEAKLALK